MSLRLKKMLKGEIKRKILSIYTGLFMVIVFSVIIFSQFVSIPPASATFCSFEKAYPYGYDSRLDPNVLILIDTSGSMTFSAKDDKYTYGDGSKPFRHEDHQNNGYQVYFGDDNYDGNNDPLGEYYHPDLKYISVDDFKNAFGLDYGPGEDQFYGLLDRYPDKLVKIQEFIGNSDYSYDQNESPTEWIKKADYFSQVTGQRSWSWEDFQWIWYFTDNNYSDSLSYFGQPAENKSEDQDSLFDPETYTRYRYPNDSRLYQVRVVLNRLFNQPSLMEGLRMGLATFDHSDTWTRNWSGYAFGYQWEPNGGSNQYISQSPSRTSNNLTWPNDPRMRYLENSLDYLWSENETGQYEKNQPYFNNLSKWFDGEEVKSSSSGANPEIRAFGGTPIHHAFGGLTEMFDPTNNTYNGNEDLKKRVVQNWCQDNWIILLTDGEDSDYGPDSMGEIVESLYNTTPEYKMSCKNMNNTRVMVIAFVDPDVPSNSAMKSSCNKMADAGWDGSVDLKGPKGTGKGQAFFAKNLDQLDEAFRTVFNKIKDFSSSAGSPLVTVEQADENNTEVYQASYYPKKNDMWEGHFRKYAVTNNDDDTSDSTELWDGSAQLEEVGSSDRKVFTVITSDLTQDSACTAACFRNGALSSDQYSEDTLKTYLSDNVGLDTVSCDILFDELLGQAGEKKLGDIYHSGFVKVGLPASEQISEDIGGYRDTMIYVQANDGMLHAFNDESKDGHPAGKERWAFIPPNVLSERLGGLKFDFQKNWIDEQNLSSRFLCDGPLVVEDVQFNDASWKTVLLGCLGYGGTGLYALDITDPDDPDFLWALENDIFDSNGALLNPGNMTVKKWTSSEFQTLGHSESGFFNKGLFSMSTPFIGHLSEELGGTWIALVGNGSKMDLSLPDNIDGGVFAINVANGNVIHFFTGDDVGNIVSPIVAKKISVDDPHLVEIFYVADDKGQIWEVDLSKFGEEGIYTLLSNQLPDPRNGISYSLDLANINEKVWLFAATGDFDRLVTNQNESQNYVFGINTFNTGYDLTIMTTSDSGNPESQSLSGWILELDKENSTFYKEYITGMPYYYKGYVFFSTFKQGKDTCSIGDSRLYCLKASSGAGGWDEGTNVDKYVTLHNVRITGLTICNDMMYIGATRYVEEDNLGDLPEGFRWAGEGFNLLIGPAAHVTETGTLDANSVLEPLYWRRHNFRMP